MASRFLGYAGVAAAVLVGLLAAEWAVRLDSTSSYVAFRPAEMTSEDILSAKLNALSDQSGPTAVLVGDSVAYGGIMADHGYDDWRERDLSVAINAELEIAGEELRVANFATNGLTPADTLQVVERSLKAGADAVIIVVGLRGFSNSLNEPDARYTYSWGHPLMGREVSRQANSVWWTKPATEFLLSAALDGPLKGVLTRLRASGQAEGPVLGTIQLLQVKRRLAELSFDPEQSFQAEAFARTLSLAEAASVPVVVVYATENERVRPSFIDDAPLASARDSLEALIDDSRPQITYLGPNPALSADLYVDHMHPTPDGYNVMAKTVAPALIKTQRRGS